MVYAYMCGCLPLSRVLATSLFTGVCIGVTVTICLTLTVKRNIDDMVLNDVCICTVLENHSIIKLNFNESDLAYFSYFTNKHVPTKL